MPASAFSTKDRNFFVSSPKELSYLHPPVLGVAAYGDTTFSSPLLLLLLISSVQPTPSDAARIGVHATDLHWRWRRRVWRRSTIAARRARIQAEASTDLPAKTKAAVRPARNGPTKQRSLGGGLSPSATVSWTDRRGAPEGGFQTLIQSKEGKRYGSGDGETDPTLRFFSMERRNSIVWTVKQARTTVANGPDGTALSLGGTNAHSFPHPCMRGCIHRTIGSLHAPIHPSIHPSPLPFFL